MKALKPQEYIWVSAGKSWNEQWQNEKCLSKIQRKNTKTLVQG